jgi:hypothetical protein
MKTLNQDTITLSKLSPRLLGQVAIFLLLGMLTLVLTISILRGREAVFTVSAVSHGKILVAYEKETVEDMVECALRSRCDFELALRRFASGSMFFIEPGTRVSTNDGLTFSNVRRVRILNGLHEGKEVWINSHLLMK